MYQQFLQDLQHKAPKGFTLQSGHASASYEAVYVELTKVEPSNDRKRVMEVIKPMEKIHFFSGIYSTLSVGVVSMHPALGYVLSMLSQGKAHEINFSGESCELDLVTNFKTGTASAPEQQLQTLVVLATNHGFLPALMEGLEQMTKDLRDSGEKKPPCAAFVKALCGTHTNEKLAGKHTSILDYLATKGRKGPERLVFWIAFMKAFPVLKRWLDKKSGSGTGRMNFFPANDLPIDSLDALLQDRLTFGNGKELNEAVGRAGEGYLLERWFNNIVLKNYATVFTEETSRMSNSTASTPNHSPLKSALKRSPGAPLVGSDAERTPLLVETQGSVNAEGNEDEKCCCTIC